MHLDPILPPIVAVLLAVVVVGLVLRALGQPQVVGYLLAGVFLGPSVLGVIDDRDLVSNMGSIGVVLLLFFIGLEISPKRLLENWKVSVIGTALQIAISVGCVWLLGQLLDWPVHRSVLVGFVISLSSTAVVLKLLPAWGELETDIGQDVLGILLVQDLAIIPMLMVIGTWEGDGLDLFHLGGQAVGGVILIGLVVWILRGGRIAIPFASSIRRDHELQVFASGLAALGLALLSALLGLSSALGAFVGGMVIAAMKETDWVRKSLEPFQVTFVAIFFLSVGMTLDLHAFQSLWWQVLLLAAATLISNTFINAAVLRLFGDPWRTCIYGGSLLSQIGEFSFVLALVGYHAGFISETGYQLTVAVIAVSLLASAPWIAAMRRLTGAAAQGSARTSQVPPSGGSEIRGSPRGASALRTREAPGPRSPHSPR